MTRTVVLGDLHFPWVDRHALAKAVELCQGADAVIQVGDLFDLYAFSKYARSLNVATPVHELTKGRSMAEEMWAAIRRKARKGAKLVQLLGNHDARLFKRVSERLPEAEGLLVERFQFEGVETVQDPREELLWRGALYMHGHRAKLGDHARWNQQSTVCGHSHVGGVVYFRNRRGVFWELNAGWLGDESAPVFGYTAQKRVSNWTVGAGLIDERGPRFVPLR